MRTGVIARKVGMSRRFVEGAGQVPVTVLVIDKCQVIQVKQDDGKDGYNAVQLGVVDVKEQRASKPAKGHAAKAGVPVKQKVVEFRVSKDALVPVGTEITADHFVAGQFVDIQGTTKGKGFAGVMKRWNFGGLRATHGVSVSHRSHGSTGQRQDPGRVFKGKKMAGHLGCETVTTQNLQVVAVVPEENVILVKGAVPGNKGGFVLVSDAGKRLLPANAPYPTAIVVGQEQTAAVDAVPDEQQAE